MARLTIGRLPYWAMAVVLAGLTFGLIFLGFWFGLGAYSFILLAIPLALAIWYMAEYASHAATAPGITDGSAADSFPPEDAFDDPVVEADLFDSLDEADQEAVAAQSSPPTSP